MRNWLAIASVTPEGKLLTAGPFLSHLTFRRPADFKIGPEGALYIAECGEKWTGNTTSQITRIIYRRGNRPPAITLTADRTAGRIPLTTHLTATLSDPDQAAAALKITWELPPSLTAPTGNAGAVVFPQAGTWSVRATATDAAGATATATLTISAGNEAPLVRFTAPRDGGFFDYNQAIPWQVTATDPEDGPLPANAVRVEMARHDTSPLGASPVLAPGLELMRRTTCFACHQANLKSAGPAYLEVARRHAADPAAPARLAQKIMSGGAGVWGEIPMPPHPQHTAAECAQMVDWILSLASTENAILPAGLSGSTQLPAPKNEWGRPQNGVLCLTASATDQGVGTIPALTSPPATVQLRTRRQRAYFFDEGHRAIRQDNLDQGGMIARISDGGSITYRHIALAECGGLSLDAFPQASGPLTIEIRRANGTILNRQEIPPRPPGRKPDKLTFPFPAPAGDPAVDDLSIHLLSPPGALLDILWVDFLPAP